MKPDLVENPPRQSTTRIGSDGFRIRPRVIASGIPVVYLVHREGLSSVFHSQVLKPLAHLVPHGKVRLVVHTPVGHFYRAELKGRLRQTADLAEQAGVRLTWLASPPARARWLWSDRRRLRRWLTQTFRPDDRFVLHCRNATMTRLALDASRAFAGAGVLCDARGDVCAEYLEQRGLRAGQEARLSPRIRRNFVELQESERRAVVESHGVTAVSQVLLDTLAQRHGVNLAEKGIVIPCCPDVGAFARHLPDRHAVRRKLGFESKFVVTYLGSLNWYQMPEHSLRIFRIVKQLRPDAHFFALTTQPEKMRQFVTDAGIDPADVTIRSAPPQEVPRLLVAADAGLLLREPTDTNRVAAPVKFGEYLAAGVAVIMSDGIGDYSDLARRKKVGLVLPIDASTGEVDTALRAFLNDYRSAPDKWRTRCRRVAGKYLDSGVHIPSIMALYDRMSAPMRSNVRSN